MLLSFISKRQKKAIDKLSMDDFSTDNIKRFLSMLEQEKECSISTRNQRLSAVKTFARFVALEAPEYVEWYRNLNLIPLKKSQPQLITYLEKNEMDKLLTLPDQSTVLGRRDYILLLFMYNTGARVDEIAKLTIENLALPSSGKQEFATVSFWGKGSKRRRCPLWKQTIEELKWLTGKRKATDFVFLNRVGEPLTRFGIHAMMKRYVKALIKEIPSIKNKRVSPHTIRHTTATHLLQSGVDINTIRAWLGHVSINTTNIYAEINMEMKAKAIAACEMEQNTGELNWKDNQDLLDFLDNL
jgi:site-specific recombinase XerD